MGDGGMKTLKALVVALIMMSLLACDGGTTETVYVDSYRGPELYSFNIIDSYGVDSAENHVGPLVLNPDVNGGYFDIDWDVRSRGDYSVLIGINDRPIMKDAVIVGSASCGRGLACDQQTWYVCRYTEDLRIGCGLDETAADFKLKYVDYFIYDLPQDVYLVIKACGSRGEGCEETSLPIWLE